jgi:ATP-dependent exoDNAse (exonuclease V) beta subunit
MKTNFQGVTVATASAGTGKTTALTARILTWCVS